MAMPHTGAITPYKNAYPPNNNYTFYSYKPTTTPTKATPSNSVPTPTTTITPTSSTTTTTTTTPHARIPPEYSYSRLSTDSTKVSCSLSDCVLCQRGPPVCLVRSPTWILILRVVLFSLGKCHNHDHKGFFSLKLDIYNFVTTHWPLLCGSKNYRGKSWHKQVQDVLSHTKDVFESGVGMFGQKGYWRLKITDDPWVSQRKFFTRNRKSKSKHSPNSPHQSPDSNHNDMDSYENDSENEDENGNESTVQTTASSSTTRSPFCTPETQTHSEIQKQSSTSSHNNSVNSNTNHNIQPNGQNHSSTQTTQNGTPPSLYSISYLVSADDPRQPHPPPVPSIPPFNNLMPPYIPFNTPYPPNMNIYNPMNRYHPQMFPPALNNTIPQENQNFDPKFFQYYPLPQFVNAANPVVYPHTGGQVDPDLQSVQFVPLKRYRDPLNDGNQPGVWVSPKKPHLQPQPQQQQQSQQPQQPQQQQQPEKEKERTQQEDDDEVAIQKMKSLKQSPPSTLSNEKQS
eukprot:TRINITY_DN4707_c0_g4_i1.p1 TRINITY_DN4707_c0_g4~~TRINITY_DN4707_c0_g4_i1.p1  ORF type:complete len:511 (+),score=119.19 TRINITY_DN4707_c0_g4_i1:376-1908(+)